MAFDSENFAIREKLPEWYKSNLFLEPTERYSQEFISKNFQHLLESLGLIQPIEIWKTLPEEYDYSHHFKDFDERVFKNESNQPKLQFGKDNKNNPYQFTISLPVTKRPVHSVIKIQIHPVVKDIVANIGYVTISNENQVLKLNNVKSNSLIEIFTKDNIVRVDGVSVEYEGGIEWILPEKVSDNPNGIEDENKKNEIRISNSGEVFEFDVRIDLLNPVYVTEQNIYLNTISALPIESVKLFGYFCHEFNDKHGWKFLYKKEYREDQRIVSERITKHFDCEIFFVEVRYWGIEVPISVGFPQESGAANPIFDINRNLDRIGRYYSLARQHYKPKVDAKDERFTKALGYYNYDIEQDHNYRMRLMNEYSSNHDNIDNILLKDSLGNSIASAECVYPYVNDLHIYTESISNEASIENETGKFTPLTVVEDTHDGYGQWLSLESVRNEGNSYATVKLDNYDEKSLNKISYIANKLSFDFSIPDDLIPNNAVIKGLEFFVTGATNIHSAAINLDHRTSLEMPFLYYDDDGDQYVVRDEVRVDASETWPMNKKIYTIGGANDLFGLDKISREQLIYDNKIRLNLGFENLHNKINAIISIYNVKLNIYYEIIKEKYKIDTSLSKKKIVMVDNETTELNIDIENVGDIPIDDKSMYIILPPELTSSVTEYKINLDTGQKVNIKCVIEGIENGIYDILIILENSFIKESIIVV